MIIGGGLQFFSTLERTGTRNTQIAGSAQNPPTPKMSVIYKNVNNIKIGYLGTLVFLDNQETFSGMFGDKPTIIAQNINTSQDSASTSQSLYSFGEKCKLDVLLHTLGKYYVGHNSIDNSLSVQDVCYQVSELKQEWENENWILM